MENLKFLEIQKQREQDMFLTAGESELTCFSWGCTCFSIISHRVSHDNQVNIIYCLFIEGDFIFNTSGVDQVFQMRLENC